MNPLTKSKNTTILPVLITLTLACFALSPEARAVCQEGCLTNQNTALGDDALFSLTGGVANTAIGFNALYYTNGSQNTAVGYNALYFNTGYYNTAIGYAALYSNTDGSFNTATGSQALYNNTTGINNTANGLSALQSNTSGSNNTANGREALLFNTTGNNNTANGYHALLRNTSGRNNTANGYRALLRNTTGNNNTVTGVNALLNNKTGNNNIAVGLGAGQALTTGDNNINIGNAGVAAEANTIRIGTAGTQMATFIAGISGVTVPDGVGVIVGSDGKLGTVVSSAYFKDAVKPMDKASEAILALKPVTFHYKHEIDPNGIPQFGLVAEEVEKVNPDLVARDHHGKPYTVRYEAVNAMLLNEFLKEHRKVTQQGNEIAELKATVAELKSALKGQATAIRKVNEQIKASQSNPRLVSVIP